jgi:hypothetical protein
MKMTMHIDEDTLREVMKITGAPSKTAAVEIALKEMARKSKLRALLKKGFGLTPEEHKAVFPPDYLETYRAMPGVATVVAEKPASYGKRRPRR